MQGKFLGLGVAMGTGIDAAIGASIEDMAQCVGVGVAVGLFMSTTAKPRAK